MLLLIRWSILVLSLILGMTKISAQGCDLATAPSLILEADSGVTGYHATLLITLTDTVICQSLAIQFGTTQGGHDVLDATLSLREPNGADQGGLSAMRLGYEVWVDLGYLHNPSSTFFKRISLQSSENNQFVWLNW